jgi:hypothetical protein
MPAETVAGNLGIRIVDLATKREEHQWNFDSGQYDRIVT